MKSKNGQRVKAYICEARQKFTRVRWPRNEGTDEEMEKENYFENHKNCKFKFILRFAVENEIPTGMNKFIDRFFHFSRGSWDFGK